MLYYCLVLLTECTPHFRVLTTNDCDCQRNSVTFECSVLGGTATVFQGSALSCGATSNEISLLHSRFNTSNGTNGLCNDGLIVAQSVRIESNCYTSTLNVTFISPNLIGRMINCIKDDGTTSILIDTISIPAEASIKGEVFLGRELNVSPYNCVLDYIKHFGCISIKQL